ncbi:DUF6515 family protein [Microbulbifer sp. SAOS-129_SWC]|uniref:DUF6515 family protein n=1 Tax=Microbulbifer sp. SAOS-129_SWC TaxID=3145235 RepID=UPI003217D91C
MMKVITAIATAGLLALSGPALADRGEDRGHGHGHHRGTTGSTHAVGPARRDGKTISRQHRSDHNQQQHRGGNHNQQQHRGGQRDRGQHRGRGDYDNSRHDKGERGYTRRDYRHRDYGQRDYGHRDYGYRGKDRHHYRPHHWPAYRPAYRPAHRHHWRPAHYHYGYRWNRLPRHFARITFGGLGFFYSDGIFYRPFETGYVVARAPIGAVVASLPGTAVSVVFGGRNYYVAYDTYYLWDGDRRGYRIVANPSL